MEGLWEGLSGITVFFSPIPPPKLQCVREGRKEDPEKKQGKQLEEYEMVTQ